MHVHIWLPFTFKYLWFTGSWQDILSMWVLQLWRTRCKLCIRFQERISQTFSSWLLVKICLFHTTITTWKKNWQHALDRPGTKIAQVRAALRKKKITEGGKCKQVSSVQGTRVYFGILPLAGAYRYISSFKQRNLILLKDCSNSVPFQYPVTCWSSKEFSNKDLFSLH